MDSLEKAEPLDKVVKDAPIAYYEVEPNIHYDNEDDDGGIVVAALPTLGHFDVADLSSAVISYVSDYIRKQIVQKYEAHHSYHF